MRYVRFYFEIVASLVLVTILTLLTYSLLVGFDEFWSSQTFWSYLLMFCWIIVTAGYYHQGWLIRKDNSATHVSIYLPIAVFLAQCTLFVKGIHFNDWSLVMGAVLVNSGVCFSFYNILRSKYRKIMKK